MLESDVSNTDFPREPVVKNPANAGNTGSIPGPGRSRMPWATKSKSHNYWALKPVPRNQEVTTARHLSADTRE